MFSTAKSLFRFLTFLDTADNVDTITPIIAEVQIGAELALGQIAKSWHVHAAINCKLACSIVQIQFDGYWNNLKMLY